MLVNMPRQMGSGKLMMVKFTLEQAMKAQRAEV
jgi:hypothetical protein